MRLRYEEHTWPELRELAKRDDLVVVIPAATLEDHGYHLPIDTDVRLVRRSPSARCDGERRPGAALPDAGPRLHAAPPRLPRQRDAALERLRRVAARPGPLAVPPRLRPHPDRQRPRLQPAARRHRGAADRPRAPQRRLRLVLLPPGAARASRSSPRSATADPGGMAHACELETSLYLALEPDLVQMDKAVREIPEWTPSTCGSTGPTGRSPSGRTGPALAERRGRATQLWPLGRRAKPCSRRPY